MEKKVFTFSMEWDITGVDEEDAIDNFQEILDNVDTSTASNWHISEVRDAEVTNG